MKVSKLFYRILRKSVLLLRVRCYGKNSHFSFAGSIVKKYSISLRGILFRVCLKDLFAPGPLQRIILVGL